MSKEKERNTWVLLKPPPNLSYNFIVKATSDKHFDLEDQGYTEVASGNWYDMVELDQQLARDKMRIQGTYPDMLLFHTKRNSYSYHNEESLKKLLELDPIAIDDTIFMDCEDF